MAEFLCCYDPFEMQNPNLTTRELRQLKPEVHSKVSGLSSAGNVKVMEDKERLNSTKGN